MTTRVLAVVLAGVALAVVLWLLRRRRIREKYAAIWLVVTASVFTVAVFPAFAYWLASLVGVVLPANLLFVLAVGVLFVIAVQLSVEIGDLEAETRTLAEEVALARRRIEVLEETVAKREADPQ